MRKSYLFAAMLSVSGPACAATVDFEAITDGPVAEGIDVGGILFSSALVRGLRVGDYSPQTIGKGLLVESDSDGNYLKGLIVGGATFLQLSFGNDDPSFTNAGDLALLKLYSGAQLVSTVSVLLNRDDVMNQTIGYSGNFDNFSFAYTNAQGSPFTGGGSALMGLIEAVDNVTYLKAAVPEPASWAFMLAGFGLVRGALRRTRKQAITIS